MEFRKQELEAEGIVCNFQWNQIMEKYGTVDLVNGIYRFPENMCLRDLCALFQLGVPITQARSNLGLLFFLSHIDFFRLPERRQIRIIQRFMQNPKGKDLYVDFNEFARVIKYTGQEQLFRAYDELTRTCADKKEMWDMVCRSGWPAIDQALFAYEYLSGSH